MFIDTRTVTKSTARKTGSASPLEKRRPATHRKRVPRYADGLRGPDATRAWKLKNGRGPWSSQPWARVNIAYGSFLPSFHGDGVGRALGAVVSRNGIASPPPATEEEEEGSRHNGKMHFTAMQECKIACYRRRRRRRRR